jgi:hypothetical protein
LRELVALGFGQHLVEVRRELADQFGVAVLQLLELFGTGRPGRGKALAPEHRFEVVAHPALELLVQLGGSPRLLVGEPQFFVDGRVTHEDEAEHARRGAKHLGRGAKVSVGRAGVVASIGTGLIAPRSLAVAAFFCAAFAVSRTLSVAALAVARLLSVLVPRSLTLTVARAVACGGAVSRFAFGTRSLALGVVAPLLGCGGRGCAGGWGVAPVSRGLGQGHRGTPQQDGTPQAATQRPTSRRRISRRRTSRHACGNRPPNFPVESHLTHLPGLVPTEVTARF